MYVEDCINLIISEYIDENINASNPYEEWANGDVIIMSKYDVARMIILERYDDDDDIRYEDLERLIDCWIDNLRAELIDAAMEYIDNNNMNIHM